MCVCVWLPFVFRFYDGTKFPLYLLLHARVLLVIVLWLQGRSSEMLSSDIPGERILELPTAGTQHAMCHGCGWKDTVDPAPAHTQVVAQVEAPGTTSRHAAHRQSRSGARGGHTVVPRWLIGNNRISYSRLDTLLSLWRTTIVPTESYVENQWINLFVLRPLWRR